MIRILNSSFISQELNSSLNKLQNGSNIYNTQSISDENGETPEDATWILTSAFLIFTMQSGFGLLEAGKFLVQSK